jgi:hypothetical protein
MAQWRSLRPFLQADSRAQPCMPSRPDHAEALLVEFAHLVPAHRAEVDRTGRHVCRGRGSNEAVRVASEGEFHVVSPRAVHDWCWGTVACLVGSKGWPIAGVLLCKAKSVCAWACRYYPASSSSGVGTHPGVVVHVYLVDSCRIAPLTCADGDGVPVAGCGCW